MRISFVIVLVLLCAPAALLGKEDGRQHFEAGRRAYVAGRFDAAIGEFELAYEIDRLPELLYNIGQAHRKAGRLAEALRFFEQYRAQRTDFSPAERTEVEQAIGELRAQAQPPPPPLPPPKTIYVDQQEVPLIEPDPVPLRLRLAMVPPTPPPPRPRRRWPLFVGIGAGVLLTGAAITAAVLATLPGEPVLPVVRVP